MKHDVTFQANAASDWLALAALKRFIEWAELCAKEGRAHMTQALLLPPMPPRTHQPDHDHI